MKKRILPLEAFNDIFEPIKNSKVYFDYGPGNVGDDLIAAGTTQLFVHHNITVVDEDRSPDYYIFGGGGNMGTFYRGSYRKRIIMSSKAHERHKPFIILPQSWTGRDDIKADVFYAREKVSKMHRPDAILAPDLALAYLPEIEIQEPSKNIGYFFRTDYEKTKVPEKNIADPIKVCKTKEDYLRLAWDYEEIHTNRLHFAIAAMMGSRRVYLYPNSYHKNICVYEAWLNGKGCEFVEQVPL